MWRDRGRSHAAKDFTGRQANKSPIPAPLASALAGGGSTRGAAQVTAQGLDHLRRACVDSARRRHGRVRLPALRPRLAPLRGAAPPPHRRRPVDPWARRRWCRRVGRGRGTRRRGRRHHPPLSDAPLLRPESDGAAAARLHPRVPDPARRIGAARRATLACGDPSGLGAAGAAMTPTARGGRKRGRRA